MSLGSHFMAPRGAKEVIVVLKYIAIAIVLLMGASLALAQGDYTPIEEPDTVRPAPVAPCAVAPSPKGDKGDTGATGKPGAPGSRVTVKVFEGMGPETKAALDSQQKEYKGDYAMGGDGRFESLMQKYNVASWGDVDRKIANAITPAAPANTPPARPAGGKSMLVALIIIAVVLAALAAVGIPVIAGALNNGRRTATVAMRNPNAAPTATLNPHAPGYWAISRYGNGDEYSEVLTPVPSNLELMARTEEVRAIAAAMAGINPAQLPPSTLTTVIAGAGATAGAATAPAALPAPAVTLQAKAGTGANKRQVTATATLVAGVVGGQFTFRFDTAVAGPQQGASATHSFTAAGTFTVQVEYRQPDGQTAVAAQTVTVS